MSGCGGWHSRSDCLQHLARHTTPDEMAVLGNQIHAAMSFAHANLLELASPEYETGRWVHGDNEQAEAAAVQSRPVRARIIKISRINPSPPLGQYPHPELYGHVGSAPIKSKIRRSEERR